MSSPEHSGFAAERAFGRRQAWRTWRVWLVLPVLGAVSCFAAIVAVAAPPAASPLWSALTPAQQQALAPLQPTWDGVDATRKKKWIEVADRFPRLPVDERKRVQERMAAWAAMSPNERAQARLQFQETRLIGPEQRQARWQAYQALPEDERKRLAQTGTAGSVPPAAAAIAPPAATARSDAGQIKSNLVAVTPSPSPRAVAPTMVQAKPGASTTTLATQAKPPLHHQPGLPKIVATPTFVDPTTLLPRRGPQAAAMRTAASSDPTRQP